MYIYNNLDVYARRIDYSLKLNYLNILMLQLQVT